MSEPTSRRASWRRQRWPTAAYHHLGEGGDESPRADPERIGAHHVVFPGHDMGHGVARLVGGGILDWFEVDEDFALVETMVPEEIEGQSLGEFGLRSRYGVTVVWQQAARPAVHPREARDDARKGAVLVVAGPTKKAEDFAHLS